MTWILGLDVGQSQDYTALTMLESASGRLDLRHLHRWDLGTSYVQIIDDLRELVASPELAGGLALVVDGTGCGRPVIDFMRQEGLSPIPILVTGGDVVRHDAGWYHVPKKDLVSSLAVAFETETLRIAKDLRYGPVLRREIDSFKAKISLAGNATFAAWRERDHDDLVFSAMLATWWAARSGPLKFAVFDLHGKVLSAPPPSEARGWRSRIKQVAAKFSAPLQVQPAPTAVPLTPIAHYRPPKPPDDGLLLTIADYEREAMKRWLQEG